MREATYVNLSVMIHVLDVIDQQPSLVPGERLNVLEELPIGTVVGPWFKVTDKDKGDNYTAWLTGESYVMVL